MSDKLAQLFSRFINKEINITELQKRIATLQCENSYEAELIRTLDNQLEEIIFCCNAENQYKNGVQIINKIMQDEKW